MPALIVQMITWVILAYRQLPDLTQWFTLTNPISTVITMKLTLPALTIGFALDARLRVIPSLSEDNFADMAWHIIPVTLFSVLFVVAGVSFRTGWFY